MRNILLGLILLCSTPFTQAHTTAPTQYDAMVVVHVEGMDDAMLAALAKHVGAERNMTLEYSCSWAGVVVLHYTNTAATEKADVITLTMRHLRESGITTGVEVEHVEVRATGYGKC